MFCADSYALLALTEGLVGLEADARCGEELCMCMLRVDVPIAWLQLRCGSWGERSEGGTHISGLFCVSITAAIGIPKLETGPQKSTSGDEVSQQFVPSAVSRIKETAVLPKSIHLPASLSEAKRKSC